MRPVIENLTKYAGIVCWNLGDLYSTGTQFIEPTSVYSVDMFSKCGFRPIWIRIWKKQGMNFGVRPYTDFNNLRDRVFEAQSYEEALEIIGEEVTLKRKRR